MTSNLHAAVAVPRPSDADAAFSTRDCDALFAAVLIDDRIDEHVVLPDAIHLDHSQQQLAACFLICRKLWDTGVDMPAVRRMIAKVRRDATFDADDRLLFKHARAKFKQLRFAYANFDVGHRYPRLFNLTTAVMGHLQDDLRNGRGAAVRARAALLQALLGRIPYRLLEREVDGIRIATPASFRAYVRDQIALVRDCLARPDITGGEFHDIRKIISRQSSFYVSLSTLYPSTEHNVVFRYLSAINGMMGQMHDDLVEKRVRGEQDYHAHRFALPGEIKRRLAAIVEKYPQ